MKLTLSKVLFVGLALQAAIPFAMAQTGKENNMSAGLYTLATLTPNPQAFRPFDTIRFKLRQRDTSLIKSLYPVGLEMFMAFCEKNIAPLQLQGFADETSYAQAQDAISQDLFYDPNCHTLAAEGQDINYDFVPKVSDELVSARLTALKTQIPLTFRPEVRVFVDYMTVKRREYTSYILRKKNIYFPLFEKYLKQYNMPDELKYLAIVESALEPTAISRAGAGGLWQFMPLTGKIYGLNINAFVDERMDPEKATIAACRYLKALHEFFGDWELALASYNCGPGTLYGAQKRSGKKSFWEIYNYLPKETRSYVPMFTAVAYSLNYAEEHNIIQNYPNYPIEADTVYVNQFLSLEAFAKEINVCASDLMELNPELRKKVIPAHFRNYPLRVPKARMNYFLNKQEQPNVASGERKIYLSTQATQNQVYASQNYTPKTTVYTPLSTANYSKKASNTAYSPKASTHTIRTGESLGTIAGKYGITISEIKKWNNLRNDMIHAGHKLVIQGSAKTNITPKTENMSASNKTKSESPKQKQSAGKNKFHIVQKGDSLWEIAQKNGISVNDLKRLNNIQRDKLQVGQKLKVETGK